ncbi:MAG: hypothetical protein HY905_09845 [Deltaproteobacteria bacterium]|nr:hypothetical protein [Deltaproteobacteria bacterium]
MIDRTCFLRSALLAAVLAATAAGPAAAAEPGQTIINSDYGSLTVAAILQGYFVARIDGSELDRTGDGVIDDRDDAFANNHYDFSVDRVRLILKGNLLSPNLTYVFQGDAKLAEFVLDARMGYVIPEDEGISTTISAGRFLPPFTLILPRLVSRLEVINYPLYLFSTYGPGAPALQPFAFPGTIGRQVGVNITQRLTPMFQLDVGVFNGFQRVIQAGGWGDDNDPKDFFVRAQVKPLDGLLLAVDYWLGFPVSLDRAVADDPATPANEAHAAAPFAISATDPTYQNDTAHFFVFEAELTAIENLHLLGEFVYTRQTLRTQDFGGANPAETDIEALGGWFHVGWTFDDLFGAGADLELVARFDMLDPDIDQADNQMMRFTFGPQFFLEGLHSQVRVNYLLNLSQTPSTPATDFDDIRHELWVQVAVEI